MKLHDAVDAWLFVASHAANPPWRGLLVCKGPRCALTKSTLARHGCWRKCSSADTYVLTDLEEGDKKSVGDPCRQRQSWRHMLGKKSRLPGHGRGPHGRPRRRADCPKAAAHYMKITG